MVNLCVEAAAILAKIQGVTVRRQMPEEKVELPAISFYELSNAPHEAADDKEYASKAIIAVDIWAKTYKETDNLAVLTDCLMTEGGFIRSNSMDFMQPKNIKRKSMRYWKIQQ